jgi:hypothetical protein
LGSVGAKRFSSTVMKQIEKQEKIVVLSITSLLNLILTHKSKM